MQTGDFSLANCLTKRNDGSAAMLTLSFLGNLGIPRPQTGPIGRSFWISTCLTQSSIRPRLSR